MAEVVRARARCARRVLPGRSGGSARERLVERRGGRTAAPRVEMKNAGVGGWGSERSRRRAYFAQRVGGACGAAAPRAACSAWRRGRAAAPSSRSTSWRSRASASPSRRPVAASSPISVSYVAARSGGVSCPRGGHQRLRSRPASTCTARRAAAWRAAGPRGDLGRGVDRRQVAGEPAHDPEPLAPPVRVRLQPMSPT